MTLLLTLPLLVPAPTVQDTPFRSASPESQGLDPAALAELVAEVRTLVERDLLVGGELVVIQNRRLVLHEVFGHTNVEEDTPWSKHTVCNIRSMTKPLTGAAAQLLIDRGELALGDPVARYLEGFDTDASRAITVEQVLGHRAGLPLTILESMDDHPDLVAMGNAVGARGPEFEPDSRFWYSDAGTEVIGALVEVISGETIDAFVARELLEPLGMGDSFYDLDDEDPRRARIAPLYYGGAGNWRRFRTADDGPFYPYAWGSQSLYSTPLDYARFLAMWMDGGRVGDRQLLSEAAIARSLTPRSEMSMLGNEARFPTSFTGLEVYYGQMAVLHVPVDAEGQGPATILGHSGSDGTIAWAWPERDLMVLVFTQSRGGGAVLRLEELLQRLVLTPGASAQAEVPAELRPYLGTYIADWANHMKEEFVVDHKGGKLRLDVPSQMVFELNPGEDGRFTFAIAPQIQVWFEGPEDGAGIDRLKIEQGPLTFEAPRRGSAREIELAELNRPDPEVIGKYLGSYHDPEQDVDVRVFIDGDYLAVEAGTDDMIFHLWKVPVADVWQVRENPMASLTFQEEQGVVVSFTRHGPGGKALVMPRVKD